MPVTSPGGAGVIILLALVTLCCSDSFHISDNYQLKTPKLKESKKIVGLYDP